MDFIQGWEGLIKACHLLIFKFLMQISGRNLQLHEIYTDNSILIMLEILFLRRNLGYLFSYLED